MKRKQEDTAGIFEQAGRLARQAYFQLKGWSEVWPVLETMEAMNLKNRWEAVPICRKIRKAEYGWHVQFSLPAGIKSKQITDDLDAFEEQAGARIEIKVHSALLCMDIIMTRLPESINFQWQSGEYPKMHLPIPVGMLRRSGKLLVVDLAEVVHMLVAGNTGSGKSNYLQTVAHALLGRSDIWLVIIDLKRLDFNYLQHHALIAATQKQALFALKALNAEHDRRTYILAHAGVTKLGDYQGHDLPWMVVMIDELAELKYNKEAQSLLIRLSQEARGTGIHLIGAIQRPTYTAWKGEAFTDFRANLPGKMCFSVVNALESRIVLDNDHAHTEIPKGMPGRAIWQWRNEEVLQAMYLPIDRAKSIVSAIPTKVRWEQNEQREKRLAPR